MISDTDSVKITQPGSSWTGGEVGLEYRVHSEETKARSQI